MRMILLFLLVHSSDKGRAGNEGGNENCLMKYYRLKYPVDRSEEHRSKSYPSPSVPLNSSIPPIFASTLLSIPPLYSTLIHLLTALHCTALYLTLPSVSISTLLYSTLLYSTLLYSNSSSYCTALHCTALHPTLPSVSISTLLYSTQL